MGRSLLKWLAAPAFAIGLGYFILGPKLAGDGRLKTLVQKGAEVVKLAPGQKPVDEDAPVSEEGGRPDAEAPKVKVGVKPVEEGSRGR